MRLPFLVLALAIAGCPKSSTEAPGDTDELVTPDRVRLPPNWSGEGVLARQTDAIPANAPRWTRTKAEVVTRDGDRLLRASGRAGHIKNVALARATAEGRARAEMSRWLRTPEVRDTRLVATWIEPETGLTFSLLEVIVPEAWVPGEPLPQ